MRYPTGNTFEAIHYLYEDANDPALLTGIVDANGQRYASWVYDVEGRVIRSWHGGGGSNIDKVSLSYGDGETLVTLPLGNIVTYSYDIAYGRAKLTSSDQACSGCGGGNIQTRAYDTNGYPDRHIDFNGRVTDYDYNAKGRKIREVEAQGTVLERTMEQDWHDTFNLLVERRAYDASGSLIHKVLWAHNTRGQPLARTEIDPTTGTSRTTTTTYCEQSDVNAGSCPLAGLVTSVDGPRPNVNDVTTYGYYMASHAGCGGAGDCAYRKGDLRTIANGLGQVTEVLEYDGSGRSTRIKDANGVITGLEYDDRGRLIRRTVAVGLPEEAATYFDYDAVGQLIRIKLPDGSWIDYEYDSAHRLTGVEDAGGNRLEYTLDAAGNRIADRVFGPADALFQERTREYDKLSRLVAEINGTNDRTEHGYDDVGNRTDTKDAATNTTAYAYDALDRLVTVTDALNGNTSYEYDALDNLTQVTDPRGVVTSYDNNAFGDIVAEHSPDAGTTTYTYDAAGNRLTKIDARGVTATYSYDALNRLTKVDYPGTDQDVLYTYDQGSYGKGRLTSFSDASGTTSFTYGPRGNVLARTQTNGGNSFTVQYEYDLADNVVAMVYPSGLRIDLSRDALGRIVAVDAVSNGTTLGLAGQIRYQPFDGIAGLTYGNGLVQTRQYDLDGRLSARADAVIQDLSWAYDAVGNIAAMEDAITPARDQVFTYDALNRLTSASGAYGTRAYEYDAAGNRTQLIKDAQTTLYSYAPDSNRLMTVGGQSVPYDATGNILALPGNAFTYGSHNRRLTTEQNGTLIAEYEYNALGQRSTKSHAGNETHYIYGRNGLLIGEYDASGQVIREFVYLEGEPLALIHHGDVYYYHNDHLGSPLKLTDVNQNVVWDGIRAPFGNVDVVTSVVHNPLRFPGQYFDDETGLHQNWFRDYAPGLGRYIQSDPIGLSGGVNTYAYALGKPLLYTDPNGLDAICGQGYEWIPSERRCVSNNKPNESACFGVDCNIYPPTKNSQCMKDCMAKKPEGPWYCSVLPKGASAACDVTDLWLRCEKKCENEMSCESQDG